MAKWQSTPLYRYKVVRLTYFMNKIKTVGACYKLANSINQLNKLLELKTKGFNNPLDLNTDIIPCCKSKLLLRHIPLTHVVFPVINHYLRLRFDYSFYLYDEGNNNW